jgi:hypothetical protein
MEVRLQYFDGCPSWETTYSWLREVLDELGQGAVELVLERVQTPEEAERLQFVGSPTVLIDGRDPFARSEARYGLACRIYLTPEGLAGSPTREQLREALSAA